MNKKTPVKAIRAKCLDCSALQPKEVRFCSVEKCPLYIYRFGKNPNRKGIGIQKGCGCEKIPTQSTIS